MARIEVEITGNAKGLEQAAGRAGAATKGLAASTKMSADEIAKWDAAARRNQMERYGQGIRRTTAATNQNVVATKQATAATDQASTSLIRHVYAQRSALSATNNLAHAFTGIAAGGRGMAASVGIATRQVATLGVVGMGAAGGLRAMWTALMGPAGLVIALSAVATALTGYISKMRDANREAESGAKAIATYSNVITRSLGQSGYQDAVKNVESLRINLELARDGVISKKQVIDEYNKSIGQVTGEIKSMHQAEQFITNSSEAYIKAMLLRQAATLALEDAAKKAYEAQLELNKPIPAPNVRQGFIGQDGQAIANEIETYYGLVRQQREKAAAGLEKEQNKFLDLARSFLTEAAGISNEFGFSFLGGGGISGDVAKALSSLNDQLDKLRQESIQASLSGYEKELQASSHKYSELRKQAEQYYRDGKIQAQDYTNYLTRLAGFEIAERGRIVPGARPAGLGSSPSTGAGITGEMIRSQATVIQFQPGDSDEYWSNVVDQLDKNLSRAVQSFGRDFSRTLASINRDADATFGSVFGSLTSSIASGIGEVLNTTLVSELQGVFKQNLKSLGENVTKGLAVANIAGGIVSGIAKQTNVAMQTVGGLLSGATSGAATGGWIGAIVGAVVGGAGSFFQASSAKKAEDQRNQMLREQRQANALLERQTALAYASSIMGQMTAGGVVTGIMRDAFGQLVATVRGDQLEFVLQRARASR